MQVIIKNLQGDDIPQATDVFYKAFNAVGEKWTKEIAEKRIRQYFDPEKCWVAVYDNRIVGVLTSKLDNVLDHQELYIDIIAVDPEEHRKGIGKLLINTSEKYAISIGLNYIWLTASNELPSYNWYIKTGFKRTNWNVLSKKLVN